DFRALLQVPHVMTDQIQRDVERSITHFTMTQRWKRQRQQNKRDKLRDIINAIIRKHDLVLHYYQGYHDVVSTLLLVTGDDQLSYLLAERVGAYFFRRVFDSAVQDSMRENFTCLSYLLHLVPVLIEFNDKELSQFIAASKVEPYYCMAWILTWFSHDLSDLNTVARIFDVLLGGHPALAIYVAAAVVIESREEVLGCSCDFAAMHNCLSHCPKGIEDWEAVLLRARRMFLECSPRELVSKAPGYVRSPLDAGG
ncbi:unnamed protein product, partial [Discosporangium mesarthrocarpum]